MFLQIENVLTPAEVQGVADIARAARFIDGKLSNPHNIVKDNVIADNNDAMARQAAQIALGALQRNEEARNFAWPQRVAVPTLLRYDPGMKYGTHSDAAFLAVGGQPLRSDISCTIFIASPADYEGGELVIHHRGVHWSRCDCIDQDLGGQLDREAPGQADEAGFIEAFDSFLGGDLLAVVIGAYAADPNDITIPA